MTWSVNFDGGAQQMELITLAKNICQMFKLNKTPISIELPQDSEEEIIEAVKADWVLFESTYIKVFGFTLIPTTSSCGALKNPKYFFNAESNLTIKVDSVSDFEKRIEPVEISDAINSMSDKDIKLIELLEYGNGLRDVSEYVSRRDKLFSVDTED